MSEVASSVDLMMDLLPRAVTDGLEGLLRGNDLAQTGEVLQAVSIAQICDAYEIDEERTVETIERLVRFGADGTASVGEFVAVEIAAVLGISPGSAIGRIADVLNVRDRHPVLWEAVLGGRIRFYQAAGVALECARLSATQVTEIDAKCAQALGQWPWVRVLKELPGWIIAADPAAAEAREVLARKERKVHVTGIKDGQVEVFARLNPADGIAFEDAVSSIAATLPAQDLPADVQALIFDETDVQRVKLNARRAAAMGELARSRFGQDTLPVRELIVSIDAQQIPLTDDVGQELSGVARVEKWGDLLANRLPELLKGCKVIVRPVIDPNSLAAVDAHDPTAAMKLALNVQDPYCVGPFGSTPARACDMDHTQPYAEGETGQTKLPNLGNLSRRIHRPKTAGKVWVEQISPGVFHWRYRSGLEFLVTSAGTIRLNTLTPRPTALEPPAVKPYADPPGDDPAWDRYPDRAACLDPELLALVS